MMDSYRAESPWFYGSEHLTLVITGAGWLEKDMASLTLDLTQATLTSCPNGLTLERVTQTENGWEFSLTSQTISDQAFLSDIQSPEGQSLARTAWTQTLTDADGLQIWEQTYLLQDYPYDQVILQPFATETWTADTPVMVTLR
jgi:hypothetical protein